MAARRRSREGREAEERAVSLGLRIESARELAGLGVNELDRQAGAPAGFTSEVERALRKEPYWWTLVRIAERLGVSLDWLFLGKGDGPPVVERRGRRLVRGRHRPS